MHANIVSAVHSNFAYGSVSHSLCEEYVMGEIISYIYVKYFILYIYIYIYVANLTEIFDVEAVVFRRLQLTSGIN